MSLVLLDAVYKITASKSYQEIFDNLCEYLIGSDICRSVKFLVFRSKGDVAYPEGNEHITQEELKQLREFEMEKIDELQSCFVFLANLGVCFESQKIHLCRFKVLEQGEEVFAFFEPTESFDEKAFLYILKIASAPLNFVSSQNTLGSILKYAAFVADQRVPEQMLVTLAEMAREFSAADRATIWMSDEANSTLWTKVAHGMGPITIPNSAGIVGFVYKNGEIGVSNDPYSDSRFNQEVDRKTGYRTKSILAIPIKNSENEIIGALQTINKLASKDDFNDADVAKLKLVSSYIGNTVELANLHKEIEDTQKEVIFTMGEAGEFRSKETGNHVKRVAEYSYILAQGCGLDDTTSDLLRMASPMHDIGKVAIEDAILKKPGKLTDEEFEIMKTHTTMGYEILRHSKRRIISAAATVAYEHHEKFNGRGYPRGLAGEDIHIFGRITALADVFDALGSDRCYKKAWELEKIFELFNREKGEHFDPKIVDTFFKNLDRILEVRDRFRDV